MTAKLFTANAISMYTNIPTNTAVMFNNIFSFGDMTFKRLNGTAMPPPPPPPPPCYDLLWSPQIKIPTSASKICYILQAFHQRCVWNLVSSPYSANQCVLMERIH